MQDVQTVDEVKKPRKLRRRLAIGTLVFASSTMAFGTAAYALTNGGASAPNSTDYIHINWVVPHGNVNTHRGANIALDVDFRSEPFPNIFFGYVDGSGQHYSVELEFNHGDDPTNPLPGGYSLTVPSNFANGTYKLQTITMTGLSGVGTQAGNVDTFFVSRNQESVALQTGPEAPRAPVERKYNIDFTKLDLKVS